MKQIISCKRVIECKEGIFDNAKDALRVLSLVENSSKRYFRISNLPSDEDFFRPGKYEYSLPRVFKAKIRIRFTRTDGKVITRKILIRAEYTPSFLEFDSWGMENYTPSRIEFR